MRTFQLLVVLIFSLGALAPASVPPILHHQGRVAVDGTNFDGSGQFKFALVSGDGSTTYWSNDGTSSDGSEPSAAVTLSVNKGLYSVSLGDNALANMSAIPADVFDNSDVHLRVWFNDGANGSQLLAPDQRIAAAGYAMNAAKSDSVATNSINSADIADGSVHLADLDLPSVDARYLQAGGKTLVVDGTGAGDFPTISAALASITPSSTNPYLIEVRPGTYVESFDMKDYVRLRGAGRDLVTLMPPSGEVRAITVQDLAHVAISGLTIRPNGNNMDAGIRVLVNSRLQVEDCRFTGILAPGVGIVGAGIFSTDSTVLVSRCEFIDNGDQIGVYLGNSSRGLISASQFDSGTPMTGVRADTGAQVQVVGCDFANHDLGIYAVGGSAPGRVIASGNRFINMGTGLVVGPTLEAVVTGNRFENHSGIALRSLGPAVITGNQFRDCTSYAISIEAAADATIAGNLIQNCGPPGDNAISLATPNAVLSGNRFADNAADVETIGSSSFLVQKVGDVSMEIVPDTELRIAPRLRTDALAVGVSDAAIAPFQVDVNANFGAGFAPTAGQNGNILNLIAGINADGTANGITFYENTANFGMSLGYDGTGSSANNALRVYDNAGNALITFENGGNLGLGVTDPSLPLEHSSGASLSAGGAWTDASSRALKENFRAVDPADILGRIARLPILRWNYKVEPDATEHIGPMAEDFHRLFQVGQNDRTLSDIDRSGVALAAIQELHRQVQSLARENRALQERLARIEKEGAE